MRTRPAAVAPAVVAAVALAVAAVLLAGCSGGSSGSQDPRALLDSAKRTLDAAPTVHVTVATSGAAGTLHAAAGSLKRPDGFAGSLTVALAGATVEIPVLSTGGTVYAKLPLTTSYTKLDPTQYGVRDPATLLDPDSGLSTLLAATTDPRSAGQKRVGGEVSDEVTGTLPAAAIEKVLPVQVEVPTVAATFDVTGSAHQLRRVVVSGDLTGAGPASYTVDLDSYGAPVTIPSPG